MLQLDCVSYAINRATLIADISADIASGAITAVVGPNGSGKTTLLQQLAGILRPTQGRVVLDDRDLASLSRREIARRVTYLPQETNLEFAFSVYDVVMMGRNPHLGRFRPSSPRDEQIAADALDRLSVGHLRERTFSSLSGGERQRVLLARCLTTEAKILVLDEPTSNLDIGHAIALFELLRELVAAGATIAVAVHDLNLAARYAQRCMVLARGRIVKDASATEALTPAVLDPVFGVSVRTLTHNGAPLLAFSPPSQLLNERQSCEAAI